MNEMVILVDKHDNQLGLMEKIEAHKKAILHRAFSVFILNDDNELLIQKRALNKYHSPILFGFLPRIAIIKLKFVKADLKNEQG